ncbi:MAG: UDP-N-acetylmuramate dehydrogenase [Planctomycetota bacterium]|jgi:UDP-N-acetylmuramate dehydrogenase
MSLWQNYKGKIEENIDLAPLTTWRIGGTAAWFAEPADQEELGRLLSIAEKNNIRVYILGGGSNLLISDEALNGLVISLKSELFNYIDVDVEKSEIKAGAGASFAKIINEAGANGFSGMEYFAGIPGTIGGAVLMNAGRKGHAIGLRVKEVSCFDYSGRFSVFSRKSLLFGYRESNLQDQVITSVRMEVRKDIPELIESRFKKNLDKKKETQPLDKFSAGCVFKNPPRMSAGELIDRAGCKGWKEGDAVVSPVHANFIINEGNATFADTMTLIEKVQKRVNSSFAIMLELEVKIWV